MSGVAGRLREAPVQVVTLCWWEGCETLTDEVVIVELVPPGSLVVRQERRVALCREHQKAMAETGRIRLRFHPDDRPAIGPEERPIEI